MWEKMALEAAETGAQRFKQGTKYIKRDSRGRVLLVAPRYAGQSPLLPEQGIH